MIRKRGRGFYCTRQERAAIGARAAGLSVSRLVLDLVREDSTDRPALTAAEMAELLDGFRLLAAFLRGMPDGAAHVGVSQTAGSSGPEDEEATNPDDEMPAARVRLSISATDDEWAMVHERALQRGLSRSRYLVGLLLPEATVGNRHGSVLPALSGGEQREVLDGMRRLIALLSGEPGAALADMSERLAAFAGGTVLADEGRKRKSRLRRPAKGGGGSAETDDMASAADSEASPVESTKQQNLPETGAEPSRQGALF
ncbi:MAG: hypothetical protein OXE76_09000, partial [Alphaproteobacteria bacterium]|nr:hypothetical protein [Alphaproteobacteria bacterium]